MRRAVALLALLLILAPALGWLAPLPRIAAQDVPNADQPAAALQGEPQPEGQTQPEEPPLDSDGDTIADDVDACPGGDDRVNTDNDPLPDACDDTPNGDDDGDGVDNLADNCRTVPNDGVTDADGDGAGDACDADADGDGTDDTADNCLGVANDQADLDGDAVGDACDPTDDRPDADGDGVKNVQDNCVNASNAGQQDADGDGTGDACEPPPTPTKTPTPAPAAPPAKPTETESPNEPEAPTPTPTKPPTPTPVPFGPDHPSLYGWPTSMGGTPLTHWARQAGFDAESRVIARIDAGGSAGMTTGDWSHDRYYYDQGKVYSRGVDTAVAGTDDDGLFRTERRSREDGGQIYYGIPVPEDGTYTVRLFFTARSFEDGNGGFLSGQQILTANLEGGELEMTGLDVHATGGIGSVVHTIEDVEVEDGTLDIDIVALVGQASIAAIEVVEPGNTAGEAMVEFAMEHIGLPYIWATSGPNSFDCSGFTNWVSYNVLGVHIGFNQLEQTKYGTEVAPGDLQAGDLVFFYNTAAVEGVSHVGIYVGDGQFIHASSSGGQVMMGDLTWGYYADHYYGAVRLV